MKLISPQALVIRNMLKYPRPRFVEKVNEIFVSKEFFAAAVKAFASMACWQGVL